MGTHPIFESDFDCLTDFLEKKIGSNRGMIKAPFQSKHVPQRPRYGKSGSKGNKSYDSTRSDDSLTSLEWLSTMGNPTAPVLSVLPEPPKYNVYDLVSLAFRLARKSTLSSGEICDMACRLNPHLTKDHIYDELESNSDFFQFQNGWKMASGINHDSAPESKRRKIEKISNSNLNRKPVPIENKPSPIEIVIDRSAIRKQELLKENNYCPDLSDLLDLSEIGITEDITGNPFMQHHNSENSLAASLPGLEVTGERIPTPKDWDKDHYSEIIVQDAMDDRLFEPHDVETT